MTSIEMKKVSVAIIYHYIAHYRKPIFDLLCKSDNIDYYILSDKEANIDSLKVLAPANGSMGELILRKWIRVKNIWITKDILWQRGVLSHAFSNRFDALILLGNMYFLSTWAVTIIAKLKGKKVYYWTHGYRREESGIKGWLRARFYGLASGLFLYGDRAKAILLNKGFQADKLHVIYNSLDYEFQNTVLDSLTLKDKICMRNALKIKADEKVIIAIGRITKGKKLGLLVDVMAKIGACTKVNYKLVVVGDGPERLAIEEKAISLGVDDKVVFYGPCYEERKIALLISMSDVSVVPGDIGLSAIHSLTYGTPVVTHDNFDTHGPEYEAIKEGVSGSFYKEGCVSDMVSKIEYWSMKDRGEVFEECRDVIAKRYNADFQKGIIDAVITKEV